MRRIIGCVEPLFLQRGTDIDDMICGDFRYVSRLTPAAELSDTWWQYRDLGYVSVAHRYFGADENCYKKATLDVVQVMEQRLDVQFAALEKQVKY